MLFGIIDDFYKSSFQVFLVLIYLYILLLIIVYFSIGKVVMKPNWVDIKR